jgi:hypothetical protein
MSSQNNSFINGDHEEIMVKDITLIMTRVDSMKDYDKQKHRLINDKVVIYEEIKGDSDNENEFTSSNNASTLSCIVYLLKNRSDRMSVAKIAKFKMYAMMFRFQ